MPEVIVFETYKQNLKTEVS